jgi:hypothetical protein
MHTAGLSALFFYALLFPLAAVVTASDESASAAMRNVFALFIAVLSAGISRPDALKELNGSDFRDRSEAQ